jgi:hypothetical protein
MEMEIERSRRGQAATPEDTMAPGSDSMPSAVPQRTVPQKTAPQKDGEFDLLCALASADLTPERIERIATWNLSSVDWSVFLRLAEHHGVLPLAARHLIDHARGLPTEIERVVRSGYEANLRRSLWFTAELARIMQHFQREQLRAIAYKGPVLAQLLYGDPGLRSFSDLDFLISPADFERAKLALSEIGYRPATDFTPAVERLWLRTGYERSFDGAAGKNLVELQWALLPYFYGVDFRRNDLRGNDLSIENLMARSGRTVVGGCEVPCLSPEDSLLALCLHAAKHVWMRLLWLTDIAETLRTQTINYSLVFSRARSLGITRMLGITFWLVKNVLHSELPQPADDLIAADPQVPVLGREFAARLARGATYDFESTEYFRLILKLRERRSDRWRYVWRLVWTPGVGDVAAVRLPEGLFPLYRLVRIGRLLRRFLLRADS